MAPYIKASGRTKRGMVLESRLGQTERGTKASGWTIKHMDTVYFIMQMAIFLMANGHLIKQMGMELTTT